VPTVASPDCVDPKLDAAKLASMHAAIVMYHQCRNRELEKLAVYQNQLNSIGRTPWSQQPNGEPVCGSLAEERTLNVVGNACPATELQVKRATVECGRVIEDIMGHGGPIGASIKARPVPSQAGQHDFIMENFFGDPAQQPKRAFSYVDMGANMPYDLSNTWSLDIQHGWKGVCVEANPEYHEWTAATRTCKLLRAAGGGTEKSIAKFQFSGVLGGIREQLELNNRLGRIEEGAAEETAERGAEIAYRQEQRDVTVLPLHQILDEATKHAGVKEIDYLDVDVEGAELFLLGKHDFSKVPVHVIAIEVEDGERSTALSQHLDKMGYVNSGQSGDDFWVRKCGPWKGQLHLPDSHPDCKSPG